VDRFKLVFEFQRGWPNFGFDYALDRNLVVTVIGWSFGFCVDDTSTWLRGENTFPKHVYLTGLVARPENALIELTGPTARIPSAWHSFSLNVPGVMFTLNVGRQIELEMRMTCFHENPHPVFVSDDVMEVVWNKLGEHYRESRKTKSYLAARAKRSVKQDCASRDK